jgi:hypothetical protein
LREIIAKGLGQLGNPAFGGRISRHRDAAVDGDEGRGIDDRALDPLCLLKFLMRRKSKSCNIFSSQFRKLNKDQLVR